MKYYPRNSLANGRIAQFRLDEPKGAGTVIEDLDGESIELSIDVDLSEEEVSAAIPKPPPVPVPSRPDVQAPKTTKKTILVVDDEDDIRMLFSRVLKDKGYHVITAARGLEAIKKVQSDTPAEMIWKLLNFWASHRICSGRYQRISGHPGKG